MPKANPSWRSRAVAASVALIVAAGIGLLVWGLLRTGGDDEVGLAMAIPTPPPVGPAPPVRTITFAPGEVIDVSPGVFYVDLDTGAVEGWWSFMPLAISPNGRFIFYDSQRFIDTEGGACAVSAEVSPRTSPAFFSPDSQWFVANWPDGIAVFPTRCGELPEPLDVAAGARLSDAAWSPDGTKLVLRATGVGEALDRDRPLETLWLVDVKAGTLTEVPVTEPLPVPVHGPSRAFDWAPDSSRFVLTMGATVGVLDRDGEQLWSTILPADAARNPRWSPDGEFISVHTDTEVAEPYRFSYDVHLLRARTGEAERTLTDSVACSGNPWTADGTRLLVSSLGEGYRIVTVDGSDEVGPDLDTFTAGPSPEDPNVIAYLVRGDGTIGAPNTMMLSDTQGSEVLVRFAEDSSPSWDSLDVRLWLTDGRLVVYTGGSGGGGCVFP